MPVMRATLLTEAQANELNSTEQPCEISFHWPSDVIALNRSSDETKKNNVTNARVMMKLKRLSPAQPLEREHTVTEAEQLRNAMDNMTQRKGKQLLIAPMVGKAVRVRNPASAVKKLRETIPLAQGTLFHFGEARAWGAKNVPKPPVKGEKVRSFVMMTSAEGKAPREPKESLISRIEGDDAVRKALMPVLQEFEHRPPEAFTPGQAMLDEFMIELKPGADQTPVSKAVRRIPQALLAEVCAAIELGAKEWDVRKVDK